MTYALIRDGAVVAYPYSFAQLRRDNPQVSFPRNPTDENLAEFGVVRVDATERPAIDPLTQNVIEGVPAAIGKTWHQVWNVVDASAEEQASRLSAKAEGDAARSVKADSFVSSFVAMTPAEVTNYINTNFPSLTIAERGRLGKLALMVLILARREFRE